MPVDVLDARGQRLRTLALAVLTAAVLVGGGWWWRTNAPVVDPAPTAGRAGGQPADRLPGGSWPTGVAPDESVVFRTDSSGRLVMRTAAPAPTWPGGRRRDLRADAWQLLPNRPGLLVADARVVTEQEVLALAVAGVPGERYVLEWFCLGRGEVQIWRNREDDRETVECLPSPTALIVTAPANGQVRLHVRWDSSIAALIGIQISTA
nr:hypothetical protein [Micromonospora sp. DSM 115978]